MSMSAAPDAAFAAIADPTRRHLIETLARGPATATGLAAELPITRQAVAKHLGLLREAELVAAERAGRETLYTLQPEGLRGVAEWSARVDAALGATPRPARAPADRLDLGLSGGPSQTASTRTQGPDRRSQGPIGVLPDCRTGLLDRSWLQVAEGVACPPAVSRPRKEQIDDR